MPDVAPGTRLALPTVAAVGPDEDAADEPIECVPDGRGVGR